MLTALHDYNNNHNNDTHIKSHKKNWYIESIKFNIPSKHNKYDGLTERQVLLRVAAEHGEKYTYQAIIYKFIKKLYNDTNNNYNNMDALITAAILKADELYNKLNIEIPVI